MKIIVLRKVFGECLNVINGVKGSIANLPVLKNFLIETVENRIKLSTTNLELAVTAYFSGKIIEKGSLAASFDTISTIINNLQDERVDLETKNKNLIIKTDNYQAKIQGVEKEEFPIIPQIINNKFHIEISNLIINQSLSSIIDSAQQSEIKPELNGVLFDYQTNLIKLAATDSFRLAEKTINSADFNSNINNKFKIIIPLKTIQEVIKAFTPNNNGVEVFFDPNQILFKNENVEIISRLINGEFPDYQPIIPKSTETEAVFNKEAFINAIKLTSVFAGKLNEIKIIIRENAKSIEIYSASQNIGENKYLIPAKIKGPAAEAVFNWRFLLDGVKRLESENIFLGLNNGNKPALIKSPQNNTYLYVIMPIRA